MKGQDFQYTLNLNGRLNDAPDFENIVVKVEPGAGGRITRVRDVGHVDLGAQTYSVAFNLDGRPAAGIAISLLPEANAVAVSKEVYDKMEELKKSFPEGLEYVVPYDTTKFVKAAISEVYRTLIEAGVLVLIVILVFLQDWRAMLVPATTVPVTIIGAFAAMAALGFSINLPTLFAIILVIGIVVDDAIVIVEGVSRYVEQGMPGREAAGKAMDELTGPVIGITLVLMSVFIPAAFLPGLTGQLFRQFALVIASTALHQRDQRDDPQADPMRPVAEAADAWQATELLLSRLQRRLWRGRARLCAADDSDDASRGHHGRACARARWLCGLVADPRADRIPADRGSGLHARRRATA